MSSPEEHQHLQTEMGPFPDLFALALRGEFSAVALEADKIAQREGADTPEGRELATFLFGMAKMAYLSAYPSQARHLATECALLATGQGNWALVTKAGALASKAFARANQPRHAPAQPARQPSRAFSTPVGYDSFFTCTSI